MFSLRRPAHSTHIAGRTVPSQARPIATTGGVSPIHRIVVETQGVRVDDRRVVFDRAATATVATPFDAQDTAIAVPAWHSPASIDDPVGLASGALQYEVRLAPGEAFEVAWVSPLSSEAETNPYASHATARQAAVAKAWHEKLDRVAFSVPKAASGRRHHPHRARAHADQSRDGPALQPGTRSYARSWIRDGAMIVDGAAAPRRRRSRARLPDWYAPYQFASGKVPCCVDGAAPTRCRRTTARAN